MNAEEAGAYPGYEAAEGYYDANAGYGYHEYDSNQYTEGGYEAGTAAAGSMGNGWQQCMTPKGRNMYFFHEPSGHTQWWVDCLLGCALMRTTDF